jgi:DNA topoisomerase-1
VTEVVEGDEKPRTASLFKSMTPETITLEDALRLLTLPRTVGEVEGEEVIAANGRYGPYVKRGKESRSLETEEQLFTITLEEALATLAEPGAGGRQAAPPLKELGDDPVSGKPIVLKEGRFGPYVTDGETNASLRAGDSIESITPERAHELIQARRERGPAKPVKKRTNKKKT